MKRCERHPQAFISHASADSGFITEHLMPLLESHSIDAWLSSKSVKSAAQWERSILSALARSERLIVVLTPEAVASKWVRAEIAWWFDEKYEHALHNLIPILLEDCDWKDLHIMMRSVQCIDWTRHKDDDLRPKSQVLSCFGALLRRRALVSASGDVATLSGPILYANFALRNRNEVVGAVISATQYWTLEEASRSFATLVAERLGQNIDLGRVSALAFGHSRRDTLLVFTSGAYAYLHGFERRLRSLVKTDLPPDPCCATLLPGSDDVVCGYKDGSVIKADAAGRLSPLGPQRDSSVKGFCRSYESTLVVAWEDGLVEFRSVDGKKCKTIQLQSNINCLAASPRYAYDVSYVSFGCGNGKIYLFDFDGNSLKSIDCNSGAVTHLSRSGLTAIAGAQLYCWKVSWSTTVEAVLDFSWEFDCEPAQISFIDEQPRPGTRRLDDIDSYILFGLKNGTVSWFRVTDAGKRDRNERHVKDAPASASLE